MGFCLLLLSHLTVHEYKKSGAEIELDRMPFQPLLHFRASVPCRLPKVFFVVGDGSKPAQLHSFGGNSRRGKQYETSMK